MTRETRLRAYACRTDDASDECVVNAPSAGKARYRYWLSASDAWPDLPLTAVKVRSLGPPQTSAMLRLVGEMRGMPLRAGQRVVLREWGAATVCGGGGGGAYFEVWADDGLRHGYVHPAEIVDVLP